MNESRLKHLEFIQGVITRMASNSFFIKGWSVTLVSAIFALAAKDSNQAFVLVAYLPITMFWLLDGYFLSKEKQFRALYSDVAATFESVADFSMDVSDYNKDENRWCDACFSTTLRIFHGVLVGVVLLSMFLIPLISKTK